MKKFKADGDPSDPICMQEYDGSTRDCQVTPGSRCINEVNADGGINLLCEGGFSCSESDRVPVVRSRWKLVYINTCAQEAMALA